MLNRADELFYRCLDLGGFLGHSRIRNEGEPKLNKMEQPVHMEIMISEENGVIFSMGFSRYQWFGGVACSLLN